MRQHPATNVTGNTTSTSDVSKFLQERRRERRSDRPSDGATDQGDKPPPTNYPVTPTIDTHGRANGATAVGRAMVWTSGYTTIATVLQYNTITAVVRTPVDTSGLK